MALLQHSAHFPLVRVGVPSLHLHMVVAFILFLLEKPFAVLYNR